MVQFYFQQKQIADIEVELDGLQNELNMFGVSSYIFCISMRTCIYSDLTKNINIFLFIACDSCYREDYGWKRPRDSEH